MSSLGAVPDEVWLTFPPPPVYNAEFEARIGPHRHPNGGLYWEYEIVKGALPPDEFRELMRWHLWKRKYYMHIDLDEGLTIFIPACFQLAMLPKISKHFYEVRGVVVIAEAVLSS